MSVAKRPKLTGHSFLPTQQHEVIIPSYSAWFDLTTIHQNEMRGLPEFFNKKNKSKTPLIYKDYRNFMVNTYRLNPLEYLTVTACRRNMTGDVCTIIRVHGFLEQWGLINYQMDPTAKPTAIGPPLAGQIRIIVNVPKGLSTEQDLSTVSDSETTLKHSAVETPLAPTKDLPILAEQTKHVKINLDLRKDIFAEAEDKKESCTSCNEFIAHGEGYQHSNYFVCSSCFEADQLPPETKKEDYKSIEPNFWTEQEDMLLLEGLEMFPTDWNRIAEHVSSRDREACITRYLKMPTADLMTDADPTVDELAAAASPLNDPITSVVNFLVSHVKSKAELSALMESKNRDDNDATMEDTAEKESWDLTTRLIQGKISYFRKRVHHFKDSENLINLKRRNIESERGKVQEDLHQLRSKLDTLYTQMHQFNQTKPTMQQQNTEKTTVPEEGTVQEGEAMSEDDTTQPINESILTQHEPKERYPRQDELERLPPQQSQPQQSLGGIVQP
ncbi:hypothetical protein BY458DRAFT_543844 [Sporodiniella umbellata]|nr:hypothetical protein BY458DRAFT_543844 [Sporodiniella umbellata]